MGDGLQFMLMSCSLLMSNIRCNKRARWTCQAYTEKGWGDIPCECGAAGAPCPVCNCPDTETLRVKNKP
jgi:hypothetical protein